MNKWNFNDERITVMKKYFKNNRQIFCLKISCQKFLELV